MKTSPLYMLALVPHRDARLPLREWSASLFSAGFAGAWSFPWVAPLAVLGRPLSARELKSLTGPLREHIGKNGGKFAAGGPACAALPLAGYEQVFVCGLELAAGLPVGFFDGIGGSVIAPMPQQIIGAGITASPSFNPRPPFPQVSFRAAALANMSYRIAVLGQAKGESYICEWKIGKLHWLPKTAYRKNE